MVLEFQIQEEEDQRVPWVASCRDRPITHSHTLQAQDLHSRPRRYTLAAHLWEAEVAPLARFSSSSVTKLRALEAKERRFQIIFEHLRWPSSFEVPSYVLPNNQFPSLPRVLVSRGFVEPEGLMTAA